ncbi:MAG: hypothetical protein ACI9W1_000009 [Candidatus Azotimanducaceae bacterium]|jgi:hypothetical protein
MCFWGVATPPQLGGQLKSASVRKTPRSENSKGVSESSVHIKTKAQILCTDVGLFFIASGFYSV